MKAKIFGDFVRISCTSIERHLAENPADIHKKRGIELVAGFVLAKAYEIEGGYLPNVLVPLRKRGDAPPPMAEIIADHSLHADDDVDLYLENKDGTAVPIQITRIEEHFSGDGCDEGLINLVQRKSGRSTEEDMFLAVLVDVRGTCDLEKVRNAMEGKTYPFGGIFLLGQFGENITQGRFSCQMLYPVLREPTQIQLNR